MSRTGHYKFDAAKREWVKVDDQYRLKPQVYCPDTGYFDASARRRFESKEDKRRWMAAKGVVECGDI